MFTIFAVGCKNLPVILHYPKSIYMYLFINLFKIFSVAYTCYQYVYDQQSNRKYFLLVFSTKCSIAYRIESKNLPFTWSKICEFRIYRRLQKAQKRFLRRLLKDHKGFHALNRVNVSVYQTSTLDKIYSVSQKEYIRTRTYQPSQKRKAIVASCCQS